MIVAAGDIACSPADANYNGGAGTATACHEKATSDLVLSLNPLAVLTLGDEQYNSGKLTDFLTSYDPTWGRFKDITHPAIGNHEFGQTGASGYFNYFGDNATPLEPGCRSNCKAWYSYTIGNWRIITLNTECDTNNNNCLAGSEQDLWLQSQLASANAAGQCKLVASHHPKWTSSSFASADIDQLIQDMYAGHTDIYLVGHMHGYERFAPQNPASQLDTANGITEILAGHRGRVLHRIPGDSAEQRRAQQRHLRRTEARAAPAQCGLPLRAGPHERLVLGFGHRQLSLILLRAAPRCPRRAAHAPERCAHSAPGRGRMRGRSARRAGGARRAGVVSGALSACRRSRAAAGRR